MTHARQSVPGRQSTPVAYQENLIGQIREGFAADLTVLDRDLKRVPLQRGSKAKVDLTIVEGRIVHRR
jgi:predicted amidohydrolase YtcJ